MPVMFRDQEYYRVSEACRIAGISRSTLWRWTKAGILKDAAKRDRRGWRLFTAVDIQRIDDEAHKVRAGCESAETPAFMSVKQ